LRLRSKLLLAKSPSGSGSIDSATASGPMRPSSATSSKQRPIRGEGLRMPRRSSRGVQAE
jgi:hypothetical protein